MKSQSAPSGAHNYSGEADVQTVIYSTISEEIHACGLAIGHEVHSCSYCEAY